MEAAAIAEIAPWLASKPIWYSGGLTAYPAERRRLSIHNNKD
jgi:hypothetical protein